MAAIAGTPIPVAPAAAPVAPAPAPVAAAAPVMQAPAPTPIAVAPKKSGSGLKITLILVGIFVFLAIVVGGGIFGLKRMQARSETADQHIARLVREAAGLQKPPSSLFGEDKIDTRMRDMFRQMFKVNKDYQDAVNRLDVSQMGRLSTPESFADPDSARGALQQLHAAYDLDAQQEQNLQQLMDNFRSSLNDLPAAQRVAFVTAFNRGLESVMPLRRRATSAEKAWVDSVDDIYSFADRQHSQMQLIDGRLQISDPLTLEEFNTKVRTLNYRREQFQRARADFDRVQQQQYQKMGAGPTGSTTPDSSGSKF